MATVVKAIDVSVASAVAGERFRHEVGALAALRHPCIVPVVSAGDDNGVPFYTAHAVTGESLRERLVRDGALSIAEAVHVLHDVLSALAYAHARGVLHGNLTPEHIFLTPAHAVVTDIGVAGAVRAAMDAGALAASGASLGTPAYSAPEQALADPSFDHRADIYALGLIAYEMLTGENPFAGRTAPAMLAAQAMESPEPLSKQRPGTPSALGTIVMQMLAKDPARRPQTADEILVALHRSVTPAGGMPLIGVRLTPPSQSGHLFRVSRFFDWAVNWRWRFPRHVAAILVAGVAVAAGGIAAWRMSGGADVRSERQLLAILPFQLVGDPSHAYFANGVAEQVTRRISRLDAVPVVGRATALRYRGTTKTPAQLGAELGATHVLVGTVQWLQSGAVRRVFVQPELVRVSDARLIWTRGYEVDVADIFRVNADIAEQVVRTAGITLGSDAGRFEHPLTPNLEAYDLFLRGRHLTNTGQPDSIRAAMLLYERAAGLDSLFAGALAATGANWILLGNAAMPARESHAPARAALDRALELDSTIADAYVQSAHLRLLHDWTPLDANRDIERALSNSPNSATAIAIRGLRMLMTGAADSAVTDLRTALARDPLNPTTLVWTLQALRAAGRSGEILPEARRQMRFGAGDSSCVMCVALAMTGDFGALRDAAKAAPSTPATRAWLGYAEARLGNAAAARRIAGELQQSRRWINPMYPALVHAGLGDAASANALLERALTDRASDLVFLESPVWDPIRESAGFRAIRQKVGIPPVAGANR